MSWWVADLLKDDPVMLVSWVVWVIGSIVLHELAHGWAAISRGDRTPIETGHMTWNPLVHMGGMSLLMFALIGIAWGMMPVSAWRMRGKHAEALVAAAGPGMNLLLCLGSIVLAAVWGEYGAFAGANMHRNLETFLMAGAFLNLVLMMFNLLPVPPLDGARVLASFAPGYRAMIERPQAQTASIIAFVLVFMLSGRVLIPVAATAVGTAVGGLRGLLPG